MNKAVKDHRKEPYLVMTAHPSARVLNSDLHEQKTHAFDEEEEE